MHRTRQTKIVATLGPASATTEMIEKLFLQGADVFRLNFSHGSHEDHKARLDSIREIEVRHKRPIAIMADLQGPKLRIGRFENGKIEIKENDAFRFDLDPALGNQNRVNLPHPEILEVLDVGDEFLMDDGRVRVRVEKKGHDFLDTRIVRGSKLSDRKGVNVPGVVIPVPALTEKDVMDLSAALDMGVDWIAQSFVQRPEDVADCRRLIGGRAALLIKLEKPAALMRLDDMIDLADAVMIARGDLGVEIPPEDVPSVQKRVIRRVREAGKPVIVATQMLESMVSSPAPTRAEASDVATAVYDGADAVMLSAETASGEFPLQAVEIMDRICRRTEEDVTYAQIMEAERPDALSDPSDAITTAAYYVAHDVEAACIVNYTMSGSTSLRTARQRPEIPILSLTPDLRVARRLALSYGVHAVHTAESEADFTGPARHAGRIALEEGIAGRGQRFVMTAGVPFGTPGSTNILRVAWVE